MSSTRDHDDEGAGTDRVGTERVRLTKDDAFHLLQNSRRRAVLRYLLEESEDAYVMRDVAEVIAAWEHDTTVEQLNTDQRQRVYISLYQSHLPKLDDAGVIEYNQNRGVIEPRRAIGLLEPYLDEGLDADSYLGVGGDAESTRKSGLAGVLALLSQ